MLGHREKLACDGSFVVIDDCCRLQTAASAVVGKKRSAAVAALDASVGFARAHSPSETSESKRFRLVHSSPPMDTETDRAMSSGTTSETATAANATAATATTEARCVTEVEAATDGAEPGMKVDVKFDATDATEMPDVAAEVVPEGVALRLMRWVLVRLGAASAKSGVALVQLLLVKREYFF